MGSPRQFGSPNIEKKPSAIQSSSIRSIDLEIEMSILQALLIDPWAWAAGEEFGLREEFFAFNEHVIIFNALIEIRQKNQDIDALVLCDHLTTQGKLKDAGDLPYIGHIIASQMNFGLDGKLFTNRMNLLRDAWIRRRALLVAENIKVSATSSKDIPELVHIASTSLSELQHISGGHDAKLKHAKKYLQIMVKDIEVAHEESDGITGIPTPYEEFNTMTAGLQNKDLIIIAGRPSMGKTTFAMNLAEGAIALKKTVAVFSLEMSGEGLMLRMSASMGSIRYSRMRTGQLEDSDWPKLTSSLVRITESSLYIDDSSMVTMTDIASRIRSLRSMVGRVDMIIVDYLQLIASSSHGLGGNKNHDIGNISRALKQLAIEFDTPVIALSQLNRSLEQRADKRPILSDLRESGQIEQDADMIIFVYRDEVYNPETKDQGVAEIIIGKQRNGPIGGMRLKFEPDYNRFVDIKAFYNQNSYQDEGE